MKFAVLFLGLILLEVQVGATETHVCYNEESDTMLVCPDNEVCTLDDSGHGQCHLPGEGLVDAHCSLSDTELMVLDIHEDCNPFEQNCPGDKICCALPSGHRCVQKNDWHRIRDDVSLDD